jgi:serine/threonine protein kinase/Flp pilus assembly protein TadD
MNSQAPLEAIFFAALEKGSPEARAAYLNEACAGDAELRRRVDKMIAAQTHAGSFLEAPPADLVPTAGEPRVTEGPGTVIGPYKLLEQIGEGGFGVVFMAEQQQPIRRKVALKVLKPGMDTRQVVARFEAERQALALMDHPNIAHVFEAGETATGRPYFAMELVRGIPITDFGDLNHLSVRQRLELFVNVCQAVQHAHQKGIIHRDLKPTNVLVTMHDDTAVVKVIDFGIAKARGQQLTDKTLFTNFVQMLGTPMYMSPEQAQLSGLDVDTRSDVYSLGVLLYELLTGTTPFDKERLRTAACDEIRRIIREEDPPKPSTRFSTIGQAATTLSANRQSDPKRLSQMFRGELDWIVMKSLEKDRNRRYETASAFAGDVQRYLHDEPVLACPPSAAYRVRKYARRHKAGLVITGLILLFMTVFVGILSWIGGNHAAQRSAAEREAVQAYQGALAQMALTDWDEAKALAERADGLLAGVGSNGELQRRVDRLMADQRMAVRLEGIRLTQGLLKWESSGRTPADPTYASAFREYGIDVQELDVDASVERIRASSISDQLVSALDDWIRIKAPAESAAQARLRSIADGADSNEWRRRFRALAGERNRKALEELADRLEVRSLHPATVVLLGLALVETGAADKAVAVLAAAQQRTPNDLWLNVALGHYLTYSIEPKRPAEGVGYWRAALALRPKSPALWVALGDALAKLPGQTDHYLAAYQRAIELGPNHPRGYGALGGHYLRMGNFGKAIQLFQKSLQLDPDQPNHHWNLAVTYMNTRQWPEALQGIQSIIRLGRDDLENRNNLAPLLLLTEDVEGYHRLCAHVQEQYRNPNTHRTAFLASRLCTLAKNGVAKNELPVRWAEQAVAGWRCDHYLHALGMAHFRAGHFDAAEQWMHRSLEANPNWQGVACNWFGLALVCQGQGKTAEATQWLEKGQAWIEGCAPGKPTSRVASQTLSTHDWLAAHVLCREAEAVLTPQGAPTPKEKPPAPD